MQSKASTPESLLNEREAARERLARQIGRLLAAAWLRHRDNRIFGNEQDRMGTDHLADSRNRDRFTGQPGKK
jgi:hypothetical protein